MCKTGSYAIEADQDRAAPLHLSLRVRGKIWVGQSRGVGGVSQSHKEGCRLQRSWCEAVGSWDFLSTAGLPDTVQLA